MKKFWLVIFLFFLLPLRAFPKTGISFVYINGSNIYDEKINKWYKQGIQKFHPSMKKAFEENPFTCKRLLKCGEYFIEEDPTTFFWGDESYNDSATEKKCLPISKGLIPWFASQIRLTASNVLHDIIWAKDYHNMSLVLADLHEVVKVAAQKGNKVVLFGYSSGSMVAYEYLLTRVPYINVAEFFNSTNLSKEQKDFVFKHPMKDTCASALVQNLGVFSAEGHIILKDDFTSFEEHYMNLNAQTERVCVPCNSVIGVIDIASPMVLFNSDISDPNYKLTYYNRLLYKYILEDDIFWLTVNYREDPLSYPSGKNLTREEIEKITNLSIKPKAGFIYDQSDTRGGIAAMWHLSYLSRTKMLVKSVIKAYVDGYRHQYDGSFAQDAMSRCLQTVDLRP